MAVGQATRIVWPYWRFGELDKIEDDIEMLDRVNELQFSKTRTVHSITMSNNEIYRRYGRPRYSPEEPANSEMPGWTRGGDK